MVTFLFNPGISDLASQNGFGLRASAASSLLKCWCLCFLTILLIFSTKLWYAFQSPRSLALVLAPFSCASVPFKKGYVFPSIGFISMSTPLTVYVRRMFASSSLCFVIWSLSQHSCGFVKIRNIVYSRICDHCTFLS